MKMGPVERIVADTVRNSVLAEALGGARKEKAMRNVLSALLTIGTHLLGEDATQEYLGKNKKHR